MTAISVKRMSNRINRLSATPMEYKRENELLAKPETALIQESSRLAHETTQEWTSFYYLTLLSLLLQSLTTLHPKHI